MRVIHLIRKPLSESSVAANVLKHGTGALNIDATRVSTSDNLNGGAYAQDGSERWDGAENWRFKREGGAGEFAQPAGRWPANLILQHLSGCRCVGMKKVRGIRQGKQSHTALGVMNDDGWQPRTREREPTGYADADGNESLPAWQCEPGCPVADLDAQTGITVSKKGTPRSSVAPGEGWGMTATGAEYDDQGGASRFFKQIV